MKLTRLMVPESKYNIKCPYNMIAEGIVVHNTANKASAMSEISYMVGNNNKVSYHYAIDDYRIVQGVEENRNTWNAGDGGSGRGNRKMIAIEICHSTNPDISLFDKAEKLAAKFIAYKLKEKGWGIEKVSKHQDYSGKYCPHKTLDLGWERFLNLIKLELGITPEQETKSIIDLANDVIAGKYGTGENRKKALGSLYNEVQAKVNELLGIKPKTESKPLLKSIDEIAREVINGAWGNGQDRFTKLTNAGYDVKLVQNRVNELLGTKKIYNRKSNEIIADEVIAGKWGNGSDRKKRLNEAGYDYNSIQNIVNMKLK